MANEKITSILETPDTLTVIELSELVSAVEERYGVSAAAAVAVAAPAEGGAAAAEEQTEFDVILLLPALLRSTSSRLSVRSPALA